MSITLRQSTRQIKRKVHFELEDIECIKPVQSAKNEFKPKKKQRIVQTLPKTIDPELNALEFLSTYRLINLKSEKSISSINHIIKMYKDYLTNNSKINESMVNLIIYLNLIYKINADDTFHYKHIKNFIFTSFRIGCTDIDFIIQMLINKRNQYVEYNVFNMLEKIPLTSSVVSNPWTHQIDFIQKDLDCISNVKSLLVLNNLEFNEENSNKIFNQEITRRKLIQYIVIDLLLKSNIEFPNIINRTNELDNTTMKILELEKKYADLVIELRI